MDLDLFTILPLAAAVFVFWKLRSVLGTRNGAEPKLPPAPTGSDERVPYSASDNVVTLPSARREQDGARDAERTRAVEKHAAGNEDVKAGLAAIMARDPAFDPDEFVSGARMAYEMIVDAFADGDRDALRGLLADDVYDNFAAAIDEREARGESVRSTFVGIEKAAITGAEMVRDEAHVTMSFVSQIISATLDSDGEVIDGDLQAVGEVDDVWTFARSVKSGDPNWKLVATDA